MTFRLNPADALVRPSISKGLPGMSPSVTTSSREAVRQTVPKLIELSERVLYGDVWERPELSKRDRSLVTVAALIALGRTEQMGIHMGRALENGLTREELSEAITHLAFYAGWPAAMSAAKTAMALFEERG